jgi:hypothetical protein
MKRLPIHVIQEIDRREDQWVQLAKDLAEDQKVWDKERQVRNILGIAEEGSSWPAVALFMRYQAARGQLQRDWVERVIGQLEGLQGVARGLAMPGDEDLRRQVHLDLVSRVLGYTIRWLTWNQFIGKQGGRS